ncbi:MAG: hypothetical protein SGI92_30635 [Bryobacteraceae bacterium]|nr:hypothetical protein [Bryobacteraceae bacterium]
MRIMLLCLLALATCCAETRFYVDQRTDWSKAAAFGQAGPYELITARVVTDAGEGRIEMLKPRDPKLGNGTLELEVNGKGKFGGSNKTLETGVTMMRLTWSNASTLEAGVAEIVDFLKFTGGPMLLGDQRRFLKKAVLVDNAKWVAEFLISAKNKDAKGRPLVDTTTGRG